MNPLPLQSVRIRKRNGQFQRFVKVSHQGSIRHRWQTLARVLWEQMFGAIPRGFRIYHRDGNLLHDQLPNLFLARADARQIHQGPTDRERERKLKRKSRAIVASNRARGRVHRISVRPGYWIVTLPDLHLVIADSRRRRRPLLEFWTEPRIRELLEQNKIALPPEPLVVRAIQGQTYLAGQGPDGPYEGYRKLIPN